MPSDKDLRDNTRAMNNLSNQMASFEKICRELNKNLETLTKTQKPKPYFKNYLGEVCTCAEYNCPPAKVNSEGCVCCATNHGVLVKE